MAVETIMLSPELVARARGWAEAQGVSFDAAVARALEDMLEPHRDLTWDEGGPPSVEADAAATEQADREGWIAGEEFLGELQAMADRFEARLRAKT